jgi:hypothetical protein
MRHGAGTRQIGPSNRTTTRCKDTHDMDNEKTLFAFKLATDRNLEQATGDDKWKARDGAAAAGCSEYLYPYNYRYDGWMGRDQGDYC